MFELFAQADAASGVGVGFGQYLLLGLVLGSLYALIAIGYTMVYGIIELINFAHGDLFMLGSFLALQLSVWWFEQVPPGGGSSVGVILLMFLAAPLFCAALNVAVDRAIYKPLRASPKLTVIVSAIGVSFIFMNVGLFWMGATPVKFPDIVSDANVLDKTLRSLLLIAAAAAVVAGLTGVAFGFLARGGAWAGRAGAAGTACLGAGLLAGGVAGFVPPDALPVLETRPLQGAGVRFSWKDLLVIGVTVPAMVALTVFVKYTSLGKAMRATAQNPTAAQLMGINADRVIAATFAIGGALAGIASVVYGLYIKSVDYQMGFLNGLYAFTAAVLGGIGNIPGAVLGGLVIGVVGALGEAYLGAKWSQALIFGILIVILLFRPTGLLGARTREKV